MLDKFLNISESIVIRFATLFLIRTRFDSPRRKQALSNKQLQVWIDSEYKHDEKKPTPFEYRFRKSEEIIGEYKKRNPIIIGIIETIFASIIVSFLAFIIGSLLE